MRLDQVLWLFGFIGLDARLSGRHYFRILAWCLEPRAARGCLPVGTAVYYGAERTIRSFVGIRGRRLCPVLL